MSAALVVQSKSSEAVVPDDLPTQDLKTRKAYFRKVLREYRVRLPEKIKMAELYVLYRKACQYLRIPPPYVCKHGSSYTTLNDLKCARCWRLILSVSDRKIAMLEARNEIGSVDAEMVRQAVVLKLKQHQRLLLRKKSKCNAVVQVESKPHPSRDNRRVTVLVTKGKYGDDDDDDMKRWENFLLKNKPKRVRDIWKALVDMGDYKNTRKDVKEFYSVTINLFLAHPQHNLIRIREK